MSSNRDRIGFASSLAIALLVSASPTQAQIVPDATLPVNSQVSPNGCTGCTAITGGTEKDITLYHSFEKFSIPTGGQAWFYPGATIQNILTRVTGTTSSKIDGLIGVSGNANLYLLNPNGIEFGPNANLSINGSFVATTAKSFKFPGGGEYGVTTLNQEPPVLTVNVPLGVQFGEIPAGSTITNRGALRVFGQDLTLVSDRIDLSYVLGGPMVTVDAPQDLTLVANQLDLDPLGSLQAGRDLSLKPPENSSSSTITIKGVLNAGRDLTLNASNLDVQGSGRLQLNAGRDLTLNASNNLNLQSNLQYSGPFQLNGGQNLTLRAGNKVQIRDNATAAFIATATGGNLSVQGSQIDIVALNPASKLSSTGDLVLRSNNPVIGDITFSAGGNFRVERLDGSPGSLIRPNGGVILTNGDVTLGDYAGPSLHILAGGSVSLNNISINRPGDVATTINPNNTTLFNGSRTYADLATFNLTSYRATLNSDGSVSSIDPIAVPITVNGNTQTTLDVRAGVDWATLGGLPTSPLVRGTVVPTPTYGAGTPTRADITVNGNIQVNQAGLVLLTNQFSPNSLPGTISMQGNTATTRSTVGDGDIRVYGRGDIVVGGPARTNIFIPQISLPNLIFTGSAISFASANSGNITLTNVGLSAQAQPPQLVFDNFGNGRLVGGAGGPISFGTNSGSIILTNSTLTTGTGTVIPNSSVGNGGPIALVTNSGDITLSNSSLNSSTFADRRSGNGGEISIASNSGNVNLRSSTLNSTANLVISPIIAGDGGAITVSTKTGAIDGNSSILNSYAVTGSTLFGDPGLTGKGGTITLEASSLISGLTLNTIASGGQSGKVQIRGFGDLVIHQTNIQTAQVLNVVGIGPIDLTGRSQAGNVTIDSIGNLTFVNSLIQSDTRGANPSGNITITSNNPNGIISFNNSQILSNTSGSGNAGDISINAPTVSVTANSQIRAETTATSSGRGGNISITAPTAVDLTRTADGIPVVSVESSGAGRAGTITIATPQLTLSDAARITATATATSTNQEGGGSVTLNASNINLAGGTVGVFAQTQGQTPAGTLNLTPYAGQTDLNVLFTPGSIMSASTSSSGRGGNFNLTAPQAINLSGPGTLSVETTGSGDAGSMNIATQTLNLRDGVQLLATTSNTGRGGNIGITANTVNLSQRSRISTVTTGANTPAGSLSGSAGNITLLVGSQLLLRGTGSTFTDLNDTGIYAGTGVLSNGNGGSIRIEALPGTRPAITIRDGAKIAVNSEGEGAGGNIKLNTPGRITLDNRAFINATTDSGRGGNIDIDPDIVLLRRNSQISTSAGRNRGGGDGGNINITTGFLLAVLFENSDITANAYSGSGGRITITANGIFGFLTPIAGILNTPFSDIAASSELGINGTVILNILNVDPSQGLGELNLMPVDGSQLIAQSCITGKREALNENSFVTVGRTGLPATPADVFRDGQILTELGTPASVDAIATPPPASVTPVTMSPSGLIEAQGWIVAPNGKVRLLAQSPTPTGLPPQPISANCPEVGNSLR